MLLYADFFQVEVCKRTVLLFTITIFETFVSATDSPFFLGVDAPSRYRSTRVGLVTLHDRESCGAQLMIILQCPIAMRELNAAQMAAMSCAMWVPEPSVGTLETISNGAHEAVQSLEASHATRAKRLCRVALPMTMWWTCGLSRLTVSSSCNRA